MEPDSSWNLLLFNAFNTYYKEELWMSSNADIHHLPQENINVPNKRTGFLLLSQVSSSHTISFCYLILIPTPSHSALQSGKNFLPCSCAAVGWRKTKGDAELTNCWRYLYPKAGISVFFWYFFILPISIMEDLGSEETLRKGVEKEAARPAVRCIRYLKVELKRICTVKM